MTCHRTLFTLLPRGERWLPRAIREVKMRSDSTTSPLAIRLFGPFEVHRHGAPLRRLRTRKGQWLLALLTLRAGREVERAWLAGILWPDSAPLQAYASLRQCLADLRQALGPEAKRLRSLTPQTLILDLAGAEADVVAFDQAIARGDPASLAEGVALYRGPLLEGCAEEWAFQERQAREQAYLEALERLASHAVERGEPGAAERYLQLVLAVDPLRESAQRARMQALAAGGNYAAALLAYRELRLLLHRELNAEPDPATRALFEQIRAEARQRAASSPGAGDTRARPTLTPAPASAPPGSPVARLLEREGTVPVPGESYASPGSPRGEQEGVSPSPAAHPPGLRGASCPDCGAVASPAQGFCAQCGAPLARTCAACGAENALVYRFCGACGVPLERVVLPAAAPAEPSSVPPPPEERRWATVLFADISGFTAMAERMDPEDVKALVDRCAERLAEQVRRFGGTIISVTGDQIGAVFGAPLAHEDDAERAVRAGLAMLACPLADDPAQRLPLHVGINTGEVVAGLVGPQEHRLYTVMGDPVNTAARLTSAASDGSVLVGEQTYRATRRVARYREVPPVVAKGKEQPVPAWEALEVAAVPGARPLGTAPLAGRDEELALLSQLWLKVTRERRPHLVTVLGDPGIGKSRLVAEFEQRFLGEARVIYGRCLPYGEVLGYSVLAAALKEAAGITAEDTAETARARLDDLVTGAMEEAGSDEASEAARHLALLGGLDVAADHAVPAADQRMLHTSVRRFLEALARRHPLCVMFEDIHWADDALLDLIEFVAARAQETPLLIVTQARPELLEKRPAWGGGVRAFTSLSLEPLDAHAGQSLVLALCREHQLSEDVTEQVGRGAGGNPLFAEELVAMIAERGGAAGIPSLIKVLISARLDALPPEERSTIQLAAVFGKRFWEGGLRALGAPGEVIEQLEALEARALLRAQPRSQFPGDREYAFKHDLIRDVAYETLPRSARRSLHGRVADWLEQAAGRAESTFDLLAHHAVQADQPKRAIDYLTRAAERARRTAAHREEAALLAQAIDIAERIGEHERVPELRAQRGSAFARASMLADARSELDAAIAGLAPECIEQRIQALLDLARVCHWLLDVPSLRRYATEALARAEEVGREDLAMGAAGWVAAADNFAGDPVSAANGFRRVIVRAADLHVALRPEVPMNYSILLYWTGRLEEAVERGQEAVRLARGMNDLQATMVTLAVLSLGLAGSGQYHEALRVLEEGRRLGREYGLGGDLARCLAMTGGIHLDLFDFAGAEALAEEAREQARSAKLQQPVVSAGIDLLFNFARRHEVGRAEKLLDEVAEGAARGVGFHYWLWELRLAEARAEISLARGDWEEALRWAEEAIALSRAKGRVKYTVAGLGTRGKTLSALGRTKEAIADLRSAVELARPVGDPAMLLRATTALLAVEGDDALAAEARAAAQRIVAALPDEEMGRQFEAAELVRQLIRPATRRGTA